MTGFPRCRVAARSKRISASPRPFGRKASALTTTFCSLSRLNRSEPATRGDFPARASASATVMFLTNDVLNESNASGATTFW